jgi:serine/threonine-protein kinase
MDPHGSPIQDQIVGMTIGNYQVKQKLGEGGMGSVYLAEHPHIGKKVALKVLHAEFAADESVVSRFFTEAKAVNDIGHPNIVDIVDYGIIQGPSGEGLVYFIMEFLPGHTLTDLIRAEAPLAPERALNIAVQTADALAASHKKQIVHRDLKPDNIMLAPRGRERDFVKLLDFGIAKLTGDQPGANKTRTGLVMGTPAYMSPEQCEGRGQIDHRSDIYSLGIVIYEMITGRVPFYGDGYGEILVQHLTAKPIPPTTIRGVIPPHVEAVVLKAMEKSPDKRFPNMDEMVKALVDPVGFVEANGGIAGFLKKDLVPTDTPAAAPVSRLTPSPLAPLTPPPGAMVAAPAGASTTLGGSSGQVGATPTAGGKSKKGLFIGLGLGVAAIAAAVVVVLSSGGSKAASGGATDPGGSGTGSVTDPAGCGTGTAGSATGSGSAGSAAGSDTGSAAGSDTGSAAGSDTGSDTGSGDGSDTGSAAGSDTGSGAGSDTGSGAGSDTGSAVATGKIQVKITTTPPGAFVTFGDEVQPRGKTPIVFEVDAKDEEADIILDLPGYEQATRSVHLNQKIDLEVAMNKRGSRAGGARPSGGSRGGTATDPFAPRPR